MKLLISNPTTGATKILEIEDEKKLNIFYDKRMGHEVNADPLGDEFKGYIFKIAGGNDKQGFPMMQGVLANGRVRLLLRPGHPCFRPRRDGQRKRKSIRGCVVGPDLSVLCLIIVKKGEGELPGLTDKFLPRRLGPKRATKIRRLFNLSKEDDVRKYVIKRTWTKEKNGKTRTRTKVPKIQRLVTPRRLARKRYELNLKRRQSAKNKLESAEYAKLIAQRKQQTREKRKSQLSRRASSKKVSVNATTAKPAAAEKPVAKAPAKVAAKAAAKAAAKPAAKAPAKAAAKQPAKATATKAAAKTAAKPAAAKPAAKPPAAKPVAKQAAAKQAAKPAPAAQKKSAPKKK